MKTEFIPVLTLIGSLVGYYYSKFESWWDKRQGIHYLEIIYLDGVPMILEPSIVQCSKCLYVQTIEQSNKKIIRNKNGEVIGIKFFLARKDQVHSTDCLYYIDKFKP